MPFQFLWPNGRVVSALAAGAIATACATNPATGERQLSLVSESQEVALGREASAQVRETIGLVDNRPLQQYVQRIGQRLAAASERPDLPWSFGVVDDPGFNAFALPGGFIYVTRGLLALMTNEAELASVLGHEIGHVTAKHSVTQISRAQLAQFGLGIGGAIFPEVQQLSSLAGAGLELLFLKYGRDDEREADRLGFAYMRGQGYDVAEFPDVFAALQRASEGEGSTLPGWLSTHPTTAERIDNARAMIAAAAPAAGARVGRNDYLRAIDGLVYGEDPRNGFFRDGAFYQPTLNIAFVPPAGWQARNLPRAVVAAAPDGGAAMELTLVPVRSAAQALDVFVRNNPVQLGAVSRIRLHGAPALISAFRGTTAEGVTLDGLVAAVERDGRVYQIAGYAAAAAAARVEPAIRQAIGSFGPIDDAALRRVQPQRLTVVTLAQRRTLAEFARVYPSAVPLDRLALLNDAAPATSFARGSLLKRVS